MKKLTELQRQICEANLDVVEILTDYARLRCRNLPLSAHEIRTFCYDVYLEISTQYDPAKLDVEHARAYFVGTGKRRIYKYIIEQVFGYSFRKGKRRKMPVSFETAKHDPAASESEPIHFLEAKELATWINVLVPKTVGYMRDVLRVMAGIQSATMVDIARKYGMSETNIFNQFKKEFWIVQERLARYYPGWEIENINPPDLRKIPEFQPKRHGGKPKRVKMRSRWTLIRSTPSNAKSTRANSPSSMS